MSLARFDLDLLPDESEGSLGTVVAAVLLIAPALIAYAACRFVAWSQGACYLHEGVAAAMIVVGVPCFIVSMISSLWLILSASSGWRKFLFAIGGAVAVMLLYPLPFANFPLFTLLMCAEL
jgi:hypothetical protein